MLWLSILIQVVILIIIALITYFSLRALVISRISRARDLTEAQIRSFIRQEFNRRQTEIKKEIDRKGDEIRAQTLQQIKSALRQRGLYKPKGASCIIGAQCASGRCRLTKCQ